MKMRFGPAGKPLSLRNDDILHAPKYLRKLGLDAMEYAAVRGIAITEEKARALGVEARKHGVLLSLHAPYFVNFASFKQAVINASISRMVDSIRVAHLMNAYIIVFHPGWYAGDKRESLEHVIRNLKPVVEYIKELKSENLWLGVETTGKSSQIGDLDEVIEISSRLERVRPVVDFAHLYARSMGRFIVSKDDVIKVVDSLEKNLGREYISPLHAHFSKVEYSKYGEVRHHALSEEKYGPQFEYICSALHEAGVDVVIISESPLLELDALKMKRMCEEICGSKCVSE